MLLSVALSEFAWTKCARSSRAAQKPCLFQGRSELRLKSLALTASRKNVAAPRCVLLNNATSFIAFSSRCSIRSDFEFGSAMLSFHPLSFAPVLKKTNSSNHTSINVSSVLHYKESRKCKAWEQDKSFFSSSFNRQKRDSQSIYCQECWEDLGMSTTSPYWF